MVNNGKRSRDCLVGILANCYRFAISKGTQCRVRGLAVRESWSCRGLVVGDKGGQTTDYFIYAMVALCVAIMSYIPQTTYVTCDE